MRLRVTFVFNPETGEAEVRLDDVDDGPRAADHDARHDRAAADLGRVLSPAPLVGRVTHRPAEPAAGEHQRGGPEPAEERDERRRLEGGSRG
ncbi:hypothetical protein AB0K00_41910 [Dactylosporangium sp. NPDC049525]|uniref:hypothetical protein n=1 Tax=Dactylosporangium sp. NPDC049525 TaxID=3154730 RepID=UPI0034446B0D